MKVTYLTNVILVTVNSTNQVIHGAYLGISENRISKIGKMTSFLALEKDIVIDCKDRVALLPGLIDAHSHSSLLKGYTENRQLIQWLGEYRREHQVLNGDDAYAAALLSYSEALLGGTTLVVDMYRFPKRCAQAAEQLGIRADIVPYAADTTGKSFFETLDITEDFIKSVKPDSRIRAWIGLEHLFYCSKEMCAKARDLSDRYNVPLHTHTSEQKEEVDAVVAQFGAKPIEILQHYGILKPNQTLLAHCVWLSEGEIRILKENKIAIAHCPTSNAKLACGIANISYYREQGIPIALGSDGSISNNSLSMFECMKFASLLQKTRYLDASILNAHETLRLATADAAKILGLGEEIGSLEVGKRADIIAIDLWQPHLMPIEVAADHDPLVWNIIYSARASDVLHVWIDGEQVVKDRSLCKMDINEVMNFASQQTKSLLTRRALTTAVPMIGP